MTSGPRGRPEASIANRARAQPSRQSIFDDSRHKETPPRTAGTLARASRGAARGAQSPRPSVATNTSSDGRRTRRADANVRLRRYTAPTARHAPSSIASTSSEPTTILCPPSLRRTAHGSNRPWRRRWPPARSRRTLATSSQGRGRTTSALHGAQCRSTSCAPCICGNGY